MCLQDTIGDYHDTTAPLSTKCKFIDVVPWNNRFWKGLNKKVFFCFNVAINFFMSFSRSYNSNFTIFLKMFPFKKLSENLIKRKAQIENKHTVAHLVQSSCWRKLLVGLK